MIGGPSVKVKTTKGIYNRLKSEVLENKGIIEKLELKFKKDEANSISYSANPLEKLK